MLILSMVRASIIVVGCAGIFTGKAEVRLTSADVVFKACAMDVIGCKKSCMQCISYQETVQIATEASYEVE